MKQTNTRHLARPLRRQHGYSLIELSVAVIIAIFLLGGLFSILQSTRKTSTEQTALAQMQDNQRIAMTILQETLQTAGYYPAPLNTNALTAFPVTTAFTQAGQSVTGGSNTNTGGLGETITVRYQNDGTGAVWGCLGTADSVGVSHEYQFLVKTDSNGSSLYCAVDGGTAVQLVPGVSNLTIQYGVDTTGTGTGPNAYIPTASMGTGTNWLNIYSIMITLNFINPLAGQPGQSNNPLVFTRAINLMSRTGGNVSSFN